MERIGYAAMFPWGAPNKWVRAITPALPTIGVFGLWLLTPSGSIVRGALKGDASDLILPLTQSLHEAYTWITDVFKDSTDEAYFILAITVAILALGLAQGDRERASPKAKVLVALPLVCLFLFFTQGQSRGVRVVYTRRLNEVFTATGGYSAGSGQRLSPAAIS